MSGEGTENLQKCENALVKRVPTGNLLAPLSLAGSFGLARHAVPLSICLRRSCDTTIFSRHACDVRGRSRVNCVISAETTRSFASSSRCTFPALKEHLFTASNASNTGISGYVSIYTHTNTGIAEKNVETQNLAPHLNSFACLCAVRSLRC